MTDKSKITDFNAAKKRVGAQKKDKPPMANGGYDHALRKQQGRGVSLGGGSQLKWYHYLQFFILLGLVAWLMKACSG